jgi:protein-S-isoprenylcysteine O-methyltransferase Ste14
MSRATLTLSPLVFLILTIAPSWQRISTVVAQSNTTLAGASSSPPKARYTTNATLGGLDSAAPAVWDATQSTAVSPPLIVAGVGAWAVAWCWPTVSDCMCAAINCLVLNKRRRRQAYAGKR